MTHLYILHSARMVSDASDAGHQTLDADLNFLQISKSYVTLYSCIFYFSTHYWALMCPNWCFISPMRGEFITGASKDVEACKSVRDDTTK